MCALPLKRGFWCFVAARELCKGSLTTRPNQPSPGKWFSGKLLPRGGGRPSAEKLSTAEASPNNTGEPGRPAGFPGEVGRLPCGRRLASLWGGQVTVAGPSIVGQDRWTGSVVGAGAFQDVVQVSGPAESTTCSTETDTTVDSTECPPPNFHCCSNT